MATTDRTYVIELYHVATNQVVSRYVRTGTAMTRAKFRELLTVARCLPYVVRVRDEHDEPVSVL